MVYAKLSNYYLFVGTVTNYLKKKIRDLNIARKKAKSNQKRIKHKEPNQKKMFSTLLCLMSAVTLIHGLAVVFQECVRRNKEPLIIGTRVPGDGIMMTSIVGLTTNNGVTERDVKWSNPLYKITRIQITDIKTDEKGGCAHITSGGHGMNFITIHLESPINGSSLFEIKVYAIEDEIHLSGASSSSSLANYQWPISNYVFILSFLTLAFIHDGE